MAQFDCGVLQAGALDVGGVRDFCGIVVTDFRSQSGDKHQRILDVVPDLCAIDLNAFDHELDKTVARVREQGD